jgi:phosphoribosylglycinamide formyltransferase-1
MKKIVIFASGSGSNAENIINHFKNGTKAKIVKVFCNNAQAKVFDRCERLEIPCFLLKKEDLFFSDEFLSNLKQETDYLILAGFLLKIPEKWIKAFPNKIINIHPALLPKYGGKGMYGMHIHNAVKANKENETGITIHFVNENYDKGKIIFQAKVNLDAEDSSEKIAEKIHELEQRFFPRVIEDIICPINE